MPGLGDQLRRHRELRGLTQEELAAAVASSGGLGFVAGCYLSATDLSDGIRRTRSLSDGLIGANLFAPGAGPADRPAATLRRDRAPSFVPGRALRIA